MKHRLAGKAENTDAYLVEGNWSQWNQKKWEKLQKEPEADYDRGAINNKELGKDKEVYSDQKENKIFLIYKEIQMGSDA